MLAALIRQLQDSKVPLQCAASQRCNLQGCYPPTSSAEVVRQAGALKAWVPADPTSAPSIAHLAKPPCRSVIPRLNKTMYSPGISSACQNDRTLGFGTGGSRVSCGNMYILHLTSHALSPCACNWSQQSYCICPHHVALELHAFNSCMYAECSSCRASTYRISVYCACSFGARSRHPGPLQSPALALAPTAGQPPLGKPAVTASMRGSPGEVCLQVHLG